MIDASFIGKTYPPCRYTISRTAVDSFASAICDSRWRNLERVPPTFAFVIARQALRAALTDPELGLDVPGRVHGAQRFIYHGSLRVGMEVTSRAALTAVQGKSALDIAVLNVDITDENGAQVVEVESKMIVKK